MRWSNASNVKPYIFVHYELFITSCGNHVLLSSTHNSLLLIKKILSTQQSVRQIQINKRLMETIHMFTMHFLQLPFADSLLDFTSLIGRKDWCFKLSGVTLQSDLQTATCKGSCLLFAIKISAYRVNFSVILCRNVNHASAFYVTKQVHPLHGMNDASGGH